MRDRRVAVAALLSAFITVAVVSLVWLAYRAVREWQHSTALVVDQRSEQALTLLTVALGRDMKGVHDSVLGSFNETALNLDRRFELDALFAQAFARFPYPESFFVWRDTPGHHPQTYVFNRVDRQPPWVTTPPSEEMYPVVPLADTDTAARLVERVRSLGGLGRRFGLFETTLAGTRYQVVVHLLHHTSGNRELFGAVGFTVNLDWVRANYFREILAQITRIGDVEDSVALTVSDEHGQIVASTARSGAQGSALHERRIPLSFLDADLVGDPLAIQATVPEWTLSVSADDDQTIATASRASSRTLWLILLAAVAAMMGLLLTLRALKASSNLAAMQSEFMSSATHELKTPLAAIQLVGETLSKGRYHAAETIRSYADLLTEQTHLLERLIDNVLAYGSLSHVAQRYNFQPLAPSELVETALERFDARLAAGGTEVKVDVPTTLPHVLADRLTMLQVLDNVIDNAIKYAPGGEVLTITAEARGRAVHIEISDRGSGIPLAERDKVFDKFYRGSGVTVGGSGLGLAIARRVVQDHGGTIEIRSAEPQGTVVAIDIPAAGSGFSRN